MPRLTRPSRQLLTTVALTVLALALIGLAGAVVVVRAGWYDVSATGPHWKPVHRLLEVALKRSVQARADAIEPPASLTDPALRRLGAACFRDRCVACHGAPGVAPMPFALGLQPVPGSLVEATRHWRAQDLYWITRHGIKMSGMPAWEYRLSEDELWSVVAFLHQLPKLTPDEYARMVAAAPARCDAVPAGPIAPTALLPSAERAQRAFRQHGCTACHMIPGVVGPETAVGPELRGLAGRELIGGKVPATAEGLAAWIRDPRSLDAHTAMPTVPISEAQARLMAEYLLRE